MIQLKKENKPNPSGTEKKTWRALLVAQKYDEHVCDSRRWCESHKGSFHTVEQVSGHVVAGALAVKKAVSKLIRS